MYTVHKCYYSTENDAVMLYMYCVCIPIVRGASGCGTFEGLPAGEHHVRAIARGRLPGRGGKRYISHFYSFSTK